MATASLAVPKSVMNTMVAGLAALDWLWAEEGATCREQPTLTSDSIASVHTHPTIGGLFVIPTPKRKSIHDAQLLPVACVRRTSHTHPILAASAVPAKPGQPTCLGKASRRTKVRRSLLLAGLL